MNTEQQESTPFLTRLDHVRAVYVEVMRGAKWQWLRHDDKLWITPENQSLHSLQNIIVLERDIRLAPAPVEPVVRPFSAIDIIMTEVARATKKFPTWPTDPLHALAVLGEEFGELTKEVVQLTYEKDKASIDAVYKEAIQCAAMAVRFVLSMSEYQYTPCPQHQQAPCTVTAAQSE